MQSRLVDSLEGKRRVVIKSIGPELASCEVLVGAAVMSDGRPGFLLDTQVLADRARDGRFEVLRKADSKTPVRLRVLVVDDSLTTRMLEKAILETAGYRVALANDGPEALGILRHTPYDLIVVDFEMPGMDGLELVRHIRGTTGMSDVPMIMLTSRGSDEDKQKGLAAGVQAYLVKGRFDQSKFLDVVRGLVGRNEQ